MKKIFVYYSESGNGDTIANYLKNKKYDVEKIKAKNLPRPFLLKMLVGGFKASVGKKDKIEDLKNNIDKYDEIVIGSPIWNDRLCSPVRGFLHKYNLKDKKLHFVLYSGGGTASSAEKFINNEFKNAKVTVLRSPKNNEKELSKLDN